MQAIRPFQLCLSALLMFAAATASARTASATRVPDAAERRDVAALRSAIQQGADVNQVQADGSTALHWAAHWDDLAVAQMLLRAGARASVPNDYRVTPLALAATNGSASMAELLLKYGGDPNAALLSGETVLMEASRTGNVATVNVLLASGAKVDAFDPLRKQTALMWAAAEGHAAVVTALLAHGASVTARTSAGFTPLLFAVREGRLPVVEALVGAGADVNQAASDGTAPLLLATVFGHDHVAAFLLEHGADPNADKAGYTALHWAAGSWETTLRFDDESKSNHWYRLGGVKGESKLALIRKLLEHGANPSARTRKHPPRHGATSAGDQPSLYESLVGATPFLLAAHAADARAMKMIAAAGGDTRTPTVRGVTPLMEASGVHWLIGEAVFVEADALEAAKVAVEFGGDLNAVSDSGDTALHGAAITAMNSVVEFLVRSGANINAVNKDAETALLIAEGKGANRAGFRGSSPSTASLLRQLGAAELDREVRTRYSDLVRGQRGIQAGNDDEKSFQEQRARDPRVSK